MAANKLNRNAEMPKNHRIFGAQKMQKSRKAQEEIFGFLIIVALVIVIGVLFLLLQKPNQPELKNSQISNLVYSMIAYTSSYQDKKMSDVIEDCYNGNEDACAIAKQEMEEMLDTALAEGGFVVGSQLKGYSLNVSNSGELFFIKKGEISGSMIGSPAVIHASPEDVVVVLRFYY